MGSKMSRPTKDELYTQALLDLKLEVNRANLKFPGNHHNDKALMEEVGELMKALMEQDVYDEVFAKLEAAPPKPTDADIYKEALQVACVAIKIAVDGVKGLKYRNPYKGRRTKPDVAVIDGQKGEDVR